MRTPTAWTVTHHVNPLRDQLAELAQDATDSNDPHRAATLTHLYDTITTLTTELGDALTAATRALSR